MQAANVSALSGDEAAVAESSRPIRVSFVISGLGPGGAEMMLWKLLSRIDRRRFAPFIISLSDEAEAGPMLPRFRELGLPCEFLGWRAVGVMRGLAGLVRAVRMQRPDVMQGWMYYGNVAASLARVLARLDAPVLWNVRATLMAREHEKRLTAAMIWLGGKLSFTTKKIINNSIASAREHERIGYESAKQVILPNGFDTDLFRPSAEARAALREALGIGLETPLVGLFARFHPMKDHATFLRAASIVKQSYPHTQFVLAGDRVHSTNVELASLVDEFGLRSDVILLGARNDVHKLMPAVDVVVSSSSSGEGFPNVIGEAMSCGVPCVVTDVGDSAAVIGDTGLVVPPADARALADGITRVLALDRVSREAMAQRTRARAIAHFSLDAVVRRYEALYAEVLNARRKAH